MLPPAEVAGWRLGAALGAGAGGGGVWRATDSLGQTAALKLLRIPAADAPAAALDLLRRFEQECLLAARLQHPNIVAHRGHGSEGGWAWLAMDLLDGGDLATFVARNGRLGAAEAHALARALLGALAHAHENGVVHRDLKPANVLRDAGAEEWRVGDFGAARTQGGLATRSSAWVGTPAYMAPEVLAGAVAGAGADLYAAGVVLFEAVAGQPPFEGGTLGALLRQVAAGQARPLLQLRPEIDSAWAGWVGRLMHREPGRRPESARAALAQMPAWHAQS